MPDTVYVITKNNEVQGAVLHSNTLASKAMRVMRTTDFEDEQRRSGIADAMRLEGPSANKWEIIPTTVLTEAEI